MESQYSKCTQRIKVSCCFDTGLSSEGGKGGDVLVFLVELWVFTGIRKYMCVLMCKKTGSNV